MIRIGLTLPLLALTTSCSPRAAPAPVIPPTFRLSSQNGDGLAVLRNRDKDNQGGDAIFAVWLKLPAASTGTGGNTSSTSSNENGFTYVQQELRATFRRAGLDPTQLIADCSLSNAPDTTPQYALHVAGRRFELAAGNVFLVDARKEKVVARQLSGTVSLSELAKGPLGQVRDMTGLDWLASHVAQHPQAGDWK